MFDQIVRLVHRVTAPLRHQVNAMVSRIVVDAVNDGTMFQSLKALGLADEVLEGIEHMQPGGLSHVPVPGAEGVIVCVGGDRDHAIALGVANRNARPKNLAPGETVLYSAAPGTGGIKVRLLANGNIELIPTGTVTVLGSLVVMGEVTAGAAVPATAVGVTTHLHGSPMGPTQVPVPGT